MNFIRSALNGLGEYQSLLKAISEKRLPVNAVGLSAVHKCCVIDNILESTGKNALIIAADEPEAQRFFEDLLSLGRRPALYPARDFSFRDEVTPSREYERQRLSALKRLISGDADCVIATIDAAAQFTMGREELTSRFFRLREGDELRMEDLLSALMRCGYTREEQVEGPGQFARRGGIVDLFSPGEQNPVRVEFWGDEIDSISAFDLDTQRRIESLDEIFLAPCLEVIADRPKILAKRIEKLASSLRGKTAPKAREILKGEAEKLKAGIIPNSMDKFIPLLNENPPTLFSYFEENSSILFFSESARLKERMRANTVQWGEDFLALSSEGILTKGLNSYSQSWDFALGEAGRVPTVFMDVFARGSYEIPLGALINFSVRQLPAWSGGLELLCEDLRPLVSSGRACVVLAGGEKACGVLEMELNEAGITAVFLQDPKEAVKGKVTVCPGSLSAGFDLPGADFALIASGRIAAVKPVRKRRDKNAKEISSLSEISPGDLVVHTVHGIGVFEGIRKIDMNGVQKDYIKVRYAKGDILYVPVTQLDMVSKYIGGGEEGTSRLSTLGSNQWEKQKARVRSAVKDIAKDLIKLYAERSQQKGFAFPPDGEWQRDFESRFEFEETEDQLRCSQEIKDDMERPVPMDRLLCGDVGFGKTEVALRAAFKCVTAGKQCAILVPTTILAFQHFETIRKRMEGFPVDVELLSRFHSEKEQREILKKIKRGSIDIVVGTHRIISADVEFRDLGLLIIDEEQRFGVAQKEKLKTSFKNCDVLTLSATPIPRTLNMALSGIRDMSVIEEAPLDRHPVQTYVMEYDAGVVTEAIRRELRRGGQVYFLHNDVASIERTAMRIHEALPDARIGIGHGQMPEEQLSEVWRKLLDHEIDVLVCTTILETGVDVPNVNTLIVENSERMGLSQLHQIRGRVGRSSRRAYAYLTYPRNKALTDISQKRLSAIRDFTEFGSGFKIALRDLEIRGAGNILGGEQHGHMQEVGYDLYVKLLNEAVAEMKGEKVERPADESCLVDIQVSAHIPEDYIESTAQRLDIYRRIADIRDESDAMDVIDELIDRFGDPPDAVKGLIDVAKLRNKASDFGITEIKQHGGAVLFFKRTFDMPMVRELVTALPGRVALSAGSRPYISVKLSGGDALSVINEVLDVLGKAEKSDDTAAQQG